MLRTASRASSIKSAISCSASLCVLEGDVAFSAMSSGSPAGGASISWPRSQRCAPSSKKTASAKGSPIEAGEATMSVAPIGPASSARAATHEPTTNSAVHMSPFKAVSFAFSYPFWLAVIIISCSST